MSVFLALALGALKKLWDAFAYYIIAAGIFFGAILIALVKGRIEGRRRFEQKMKRADEKAALKTERIKEDVQKATDKEVNRRLERWYRD
jgi:hypothetical protein